MCFWPSHLACTSALGVADFFRSRQTTGTLDGTPSLWLSALSFTFWGLSILQQLVLAFDPLSMPFEYGCMCVTNQLRWQKNVMFEDSLWHMIPYPTHKRLMDQSKGRLMSSQWSLQQTGRPTLAGWCQPNKPNEHTLYGPSCTNTGHQPPSSYNRQISHITASDHTGKHTSHYGWSKRTRNKASAWHTLIQNN